MIKRIRFLSDHKIAVFRDRRLLRGFTRKLGIMGSSTKFCLRWNDFEANISSAFLDLKEEKDFADVTLVCAEGQVEAHKVILAASSPFFKKILKQSPHSHPLIYLKGIKLSDVEALLKFIYHGEVNVEEANLDTFLEVADEVKVKGLVQDHGKRERDVSSIQSSVPRPSSTTQLSSPRSSLQSLAQTQGQLSSQTEQESSTSVNNNGVVQVKVESEETFLAPVLEENQQPNYLESPNHHQEQCSQFCSSNIKDRNESTVHKYSPTVSILYL